MRAYLICLSLAFSAIGFSQTKARNTLPQQPKTNDQPNFDRMWLSAEIPQNSDQYNIVTTNAVDGSATGNSIIYVFDFDRSGKRYPVGTISDGQAVKLDLFKLKGKTLYYSIPWGEISPTYEKKGKGALPTVAWISGRNLKVVGFASK